MKNLKINKLKLVMIVCLIPLYYISNAQTNEIRIIIKDQSSSKAIPNAKLSIYNLNSDSIKVHEADSTGIISFKLFTSGKYKFVISCSGYQDEIIKYESKIKEDSYLRTVIALKPITNEESEWAYINAREAN